MVGEMRNRFSRSYQTVLLVCMPSPPSPSPSSPSSPLRSPTPAPSLCLHLLHPQWWYVSLLPAFPSLVPWITGHRRFVDICRWWQWWWKEIRSWVEMVLFHARWRTQTPSFFNPQCLQASQDSVTSRMTNDARGRTLGNTHWKDNTNDWRCRLCEIMKHMRLRGSAGLTGVRRLRCLRRNRENVGEGNLVRSKTHEGRVEGWQSWSQRRNWNIWKPWPVRRATAFRTELVCIIG